MPNYIINQCLTNDQYIVSAVTLVLGGSIRFGEGENLFCGTVEAVTESSITTGYYYDLIDYRDCCECLVDDGRGTLNFNFIICGTEDEINIEATNFCLEYGLPTTGITYEIQFGFETPFCATFVGLSEEGETNYHYVSGEYANCEECGEEPEPEPPRSANAAEDVCVVVCTSGGTTTVSVEPPHPVWTDNYGTEVIQMNAVTLGGNGLNS